MTSENKFSLYSLLHNNKFLVVISFLIAFIVWITVSLNESPEVERVIENVKVNVDESVPSQLGYKAFGGEDIYIDITVRGKRYLVGDNVLNAEDFDVVALSSKVDKPGRYTLQVKAVPKNAQAGYTIIAKSKDYVEIYFDQPKTLELPVEPDVINSSDKLLFSDEYLAEAPFPSKLKINVSGPATKVDKIKHVKATVETNGNLKETETKLAKISFIDSYGKEVEYVHNEDSDSDITVTIPVYLKKELPVTVDFIRSPLYYIENPLEIVATPAKAAFAVETGKVSTLENISIGKIPFSKLLPGVNTFTFDTSDIKSAIPINEKQSFTVYVNTGDVHEKDFVITADQISFSGTNDKYKLSLAPSTSFQIKAIGPKAELDKLTADSIRAEIDITSAVIDSGKNNLPVDFSVKGNDFCWVYGEYNASVRAVAK